MESCLSHEGQMVWNVQSWWDEMRWFSSKTDATDKERISSWKNVSKSDCWTKDVSTKSLFSISFFLFRGGHSFVLPLFLGCLSFLPSGKVKFTERVPHKLLNGVRMREGTEGWQWAVKTTWPSWCSFNWCYWFPILPANLNALRVEENLSHCVGEWPAESF